MRNTVYMGDDSGTVYMLQNITLSISGNATEIGQKGDKGAKESRYSRRKR